MWRCLFDHRGNCRHRAGPGPIGAEKACTDPAATSSPAPGRKPVFQYEIRIFKDGAPITPTMKLAAQADIPSEFEIPEGTVELAFPAQSFSQKQSAATWAGRALGI